jgi:hypothetical protein
MKYQFNDIMNGSLADGDTRLVITDGRTLATTEAEIALAERYGGKPVLETLDTPAVEADIAPGAEPPARRGGKK